MCSKVLERLDRDGVIARYVLQQSAPPSTALYCACATLYCVSSYDITQSIGLGSVYVPEEKLVATQHLLDASNLLFRFVLETKQYEEKFRFVHHKIRRRLLGQLTTAAARRLRVRDQSLLRR